jgi:hypothetical protein
LDGSSFEVSNDFLSIILEGWSFAIATLMDVPPVSIPANNISDWFIWTNHI